MFQNYFLPDFYPITWKANLSNAETGRVQDHSSRNIWLDLVLRKIHADSSLWNRVSVQVYAVALNNLSLLNS